MTDLVEVCSVSNTLVLEGGFLDDLGSSDVHSMSSPTITLAPYVSLQAATMRNPHTISRHFEDSRGPLSIIYTV